LPNKPELHKNNGETKRYQFHCEQKKEIGLKIEDLKKKLSLN